MYWILTHDALNDSIAISDSASSRSWNRTRSTLFNFFRLLSNFAYSCLFKLCPNIFFAAGDTDIFGIKLGKWPWQKICFSKNFHVWSPARTRSPENNLYLCGGVVFVLLTRPNEVRWEGRGSLRTIYFCQYTEWMRRVREWFYDISNKFFDSKVIIYHQCLQIKWIFHRMCLCFCYETYLQIDFLIRPSP